MFKAIFLLVISVLLLSISSPSAQAKVLPQAAKSSGKAVVRSSGTAIGVYPRLRADRKAVIVNFTNLGNAKSVSYMLVYKTATQEEAAMGALDLTGASTATRELLFATCSNNICRYHTGIKNARLEVSYTSTTGKKYLKKFRIKI